MAGFGVDRRHDHVHIGDPSVADEDLVAVEDPVAVRAPGSSRDRPDVAAAGRLGDGQGRALEVARRAEALGRPLDQLLGCSRPRDRGKRQRRHDNREADARATPEQLFHQ